MSSTPNKKSGKVSSAVIEIDLDPAPAATQEVEMVQEIKQEETTSTHNIASSSQSTSDEVCNIARTQYFVCRFLIIFYILMLYVFCCLDPYFHQE